MTSQVEESQGSSRPVAGGTGVNGLKKFDLHESEPVGETHFHMNGLARRLVLTQRQKVTQTNSAT